MGCKHEAKAVNKKIAAPGKKRYDAHVRKRYVDDLRAFLAGNYVYNWTLVCDGFDIDFTRGHNDSILVVVKEK